MWIFSMPGTLDSREADLETLWDAGATGLEERAGLVRAYFSERADLPLDGEWAEEPEQDWQEQFKRDLKPVPAGRFTIVAPWQTAEVAAGSTPLVIEVGMAFGTGHHATTRMAVEALSELDMSAVGPVVEGRRLARVLDVGTGSGVLALAASMLGAGLAVGVDIDPITIPAAFENARMNGFTDSGTGVVTNPETGGKLLFAEGTIDDALLSEIGATAYDVVVANLYAELHDVLVGQYRDVITDGGHVVLTGILTDRLPIVLAALEREGFSDARVRESGEWALVTARAS
ncbi:50S ribosomal protein L11 methyltransferase [Deinococcus pimensis]|uniref:50S ribosomal protein L11 methyltransferase n=1 Tax=Deinococcus pimensis TaxID=309888 RepID=UPI00048A34CA|nr:50S ribosomal protein L11 methyltransferase [Deinococcus pimensis]